MKTPKKYSLHVWCYSPEIDPISGLFNVAEEEEMERRADMFNKACSQKLQCLDEDDDEIWSDSNQGSRYTFQTVLIDTKRNER